MPCANQLISGTIQGATGVTGVGRAVLLADASIQVVGHGAAQLAISHANWLAYGDMIRAESIRQTARRFSTGPDNLSIDSRLGDAACTCRLKVLEPR